MNLERIVNTPLPHAARIHTAHFGLAHRRSISFTCAWSVRQLTASALADRFSLSFLAFDPLSSRHPQCVHSRSLVSDARAVGWITIPGVAITASFFLGFLELGTQLEQPFGYVRVSAAQADR